MRFMVQMVCWGIISLGALLGVNIFTLDLGVQGLGCL